MKCLLALGFFFLTSVSAAPAQQNIADTATPFILKELNLSKAQFIAIKTLIIEYRREERIRREELRNHIFFLMNARQQMIFKIRRLKR